MTLEAELHEAELTERLGQLSEAEALLQRCVNTSPNDERPLLKLGWLYYRTGRRLEAEARFAEVIENRYSLQDPRAHGAAFDQYCHAIFRSGVNEQTVNKIDELCSSEILQHGCQSWTELFRGAVSFCRGDIDMSFRHFQRCIDFGDSILGNCFGSYTYKSDDFLVYLDEHQPPVPRDVLGLGLTNLESSSTELTAKVLYVVACDGKYLERFGKDFLESYCMQCQNTVCHLHVVNPTEGSNALLTALLSDIAGVKINVSTSEFRFSPGISKLNKKALFTCLRFLILPPLMRAYDLPILVSEFDGELALAPATYIEPLAGTDLGLSFYDHMNFFPWNTIWAGTVFINNTEPGKQFANRLANFCASFLEKLELGGNLWHIDQNGLHCVHRFMRNRDPDLRVMNIKQTRPALIRHHGGIY